MKSQALREMESKALTGNCFNWKPLNLSLGTDRLLACLLNTLKHIRVIKARGRFTYLKGSLFEGSICRKARLVKETDESRHRVPNYDARFLFFPFFEIEQDLFYFVRREWYLACGWLPSEIAGGWRGGDTWARSSRSFYSMAVSLADRRQTIHRTTPSLNRARLCSRNRNAICSS